MDTGRCSWAPPGRWCYHRSSRLDTAYRSSAQSHSGTSRSHRSEAQSFPWCKSIPRGSCKFQNKVKQFLWSDWLHNVVQNHINTVIQQIETCIMWLQKEILTIIRMLTQPYTQTHTYFIGFPSCSLKHLLFTRKKCCILWNHGSKEKTVLRNCISLIQWNLVIKRSDKTKPSYNKVILLVPALYISLFFYPDIMRNLI